jgi:lysozyme family protein
MSDFNTALQHTLKEEGGFVNDPRDPGGMTNLGVTARVWGEWVGHEPSEKEMRALTPEKVSPLYRRKYWDACRADDIFSGLDLCVFDVAVNSGPGRAVKFLQECVGTTPDGGIGPVTLSAVRAHSVTDEDKKILINDFCDKRVQFWKSLPTFGHFGNGWLARGERVRKAALAMV